MNPVLVQMQPRNLELSLSSIRRNIRIPRVWFRAFDEPDVCQAINEFVRDTEYTHYIINADDCVVYEEGIACVLEHGEEHPIFTGWVNMYVDEDLEISSLSSVAVGELSLDRDPQTGERDTRKSGFPPWKTVAQVEEVDGTQETCYASFALSCLPREVLMEFPLQTYPNGKGSDYHLSYRLQQKGYKFYTHRDAFCLHLRRSMWQSYTPEEHWLVGKQDPSVIRELEPSQYMGASQ